MGAKSNDDERRGLSLHIKLGVKSKKPFFYLYSYVSLFCNFQGERKKLLHIFLKQFIIVYKNWEPVDLAESPDSVEYPLHSDDMVVGCSAGHPADVIVMLIEEATHIATLVTECKFFFFLFNFLSG